MTGRLRRLRSGRVLSAGLAAAAVLPVALLMSRADGMPPTRPELSGGGAWLASPAQGLVTLIDGASEQVVGSVRAPGAQSGDELSVVQAGPSAYIVQPGHGTVSRVDGATYQVAQPIRFGDGGASGALQVYAGAGSAYVVDPRRRIASVTDPVTLAVRQRLSLAAQPGPGQSVVDGAGRLWVVDGGGLAWFDRTGKHVRTDVGDATSQLVLVGGRAQLVEPSRSRVGRLADDGSVGQWSCLDLRAGDQVQLLGSDVLDRVLAAIPATGVMVASGTGGEDCGLAVDVGRPGDVLGPLVESGGFVFVPNRSRGHTEVVDLTARRLVADLPVVPPGARLELLAKDGLVFYNDLDSDRAGVIRFDGGQWRLGRSLHKYVRTAGGVQVLAPAAPAPAANAPAKAPAKAPGAGQPNPPPEQTPPTGPTPPGGTDRPPPGAPVAPTTGPPPPEGSRPPVRITVQVAGDGTVTARSPAPLNAPAGTVCRADSTCGWDYRVGTTAVLWLPAMPAAGVALKRLTGCTTAVPAAGGTVCRVRVRAAATVRAEFAPVPPNDVTLTVTARGSGALAATPAGGAPQQCAPTCRLPVPPGSSVQLSATAADGSYLADWGVSNCPASAVSCTLTVPAAQTVTVDFAALVDLTVAVAGSGAGTVSGTGLSCTASGCTGQYRPGTQVTVTGTPDAVSLLGGWSGCQTTSGAACTVTLDQNTAATVTFDANPIAPYLGNWSNVDSSTSGITRVQLDRTSATTASLQMFGKCHPDDCTFPATPATLSGGVVTAHIDQDFAQRNIRITLSGSQLIVQMHTHFIDNSGRADYDLTETMTLA